MLVYVDESGDTGLKLDQGSTPYFVVAAVMFEDQADADACSKRMEEVKKRLHMSKNFEFKFNKSSRDIRVMLLTAVLECRFRYMFMAFNKKKAWGPGFQYKETVAKYPLRMLFTQAMPYLRDATVIIDRCGDQDFRRTMQAYLRRHTRTKDGKGDSPIRHVTDRDSKKDNLVQLADMVVGASARWYRKEKDDHHVYRTIIKPLELGHVVWPK